MPGRDDQAIEVAEGTTIIIQQQQQQGDGREPGDALGYIIGLLSPLVVLMFVLAGHDAIDQRVPDTDMAVILYTTAIGLGLVAVAGAALRPGRAITLSVGLIAGTALAVPSHAMLDQYGPESGAGIIVLPVMFFLFIIAITAAIIRGPPGSTTALASGLALSVALAGSALALLIDLEADAAHAQAEWSRETPLGWLVPLLAIGLTVFIGRQRRR